jgi:polyphosphate kinase 2 (PPK2 family)
VFDRSHYEDVVVARVSALAAPEEIERRYGAINQFETRLAAAGVVIIKCFLNVSYEKQGERLSERLDRPDKHWKYNPGDLDTRRQWADHRAAYETALERCNTPVAPWYVVPADRKWYRNWAVARLLAEALDSLALAWPAADFDVAAERRRLASLG